jgi:isopenicillin N synthase-like dioxygenase
MAPNRWPNDPAGLQQAAEAFWVACEATGQRLLALIAEIMKVNIADFLAYFEQPLDQHDAAALSAQQSE